MLLRSPRSRSVLTLLTAAAMLASASHAFAADGSWIGPSGGFWLNAANWTPAVPNAIDSIATLPATATAQTVAVNGPVTIGSLFIDSPFAYSIAASGGSLTLQTSSGNASITSTAAVTTGNNTISTTTNLLSPTVITNLSPTHALVFFGSFTGNKSLSVNGPGIVTLFAASAGWSGDLIINSANLVASVGNALGTGNASINSGGTLTLNTVNSKAITLNGGTLKSGTASVITVSGSLTVSANSTVTTAGNGTFQLGVLTGAGNLAFTTGSFTLTSANSYAAAISIDNGTLQINNTQSLGAGTGIDANGTIVNNAGILRLAAGITLAGEKITLNPGGSLTAASASSGGYANPILANGGVLTGASFTGTLSGTGDFFATSATLAGTGNYTGNAIFTGNMTVSKNTALSALGRTIINSGTTTVTVPVNGPIIVNSGAVLTQTGAGNFAAHTVNLNGGKLSLTSNLSVANLFDPATTGGTISLDSGGVFTSGADNAINFSTIPGGANLSLSTSVSTTIGAAVVLTPDSTTNTFRFGGTGTSGTLTLQPIITDVAAVPTHINVNAGPLIILQGVNSYSGITTVNGNLTVANTMGLGTGSGSDADGTVVNSSGVLRLGAGITLSGEKIALNPGGSLTAASATSGGYAGPILANGGVLSSTTFTGTLSGTGDFFANSANLAGSGNYTGNATFTGNMTVSKDTALSPFGRVIINSGTTTVTAPVNSPIIVSPGATLKQAGSGSFAAHTVILNGARLSVANNLSIANIFDPATTGGTISLDSGGVYTAGADNAIDFSAIPNGENFSLGAAVVTTIGAAVVLTPDNVTHTLRFGGIGAALILQSSLSDFASIPTLVNVSSGFSIVLQTASSYSGITTINGSVTVNNSLGLGAGSGTDADGTVVNATGALTSTQLLPNEKITLNGGTLSVITAGLVQVNAASTIANGSYSGPVVLNAPCTFAGGTFAGPISGAIDISINASIQFSGNNTFTGNLTVVSGGNLFAASPNALGDALSKTTIASGGVLNLYSNSTKTLNLASGSLNLADGVNYAGIIRSAGGTIAGAGTAAFASPLQLDSGTTTILGSVRLAGTAGPGSWVAGNSSLAAADVIIDGPIANTGNTTFISGNVSINTSGLLFNSIKVRFAIVTVNGPNSFTNFSTDTSGGQPLANITFNAPTTIANFTLGGGTALFAAPANIFSYQAASGNVTFAQGGNFYYSPSNLLATTFLNGPSTFHAPFAFSGVIANAPLSLKYGINGRADSTFNATNTLNGDWILKGGTLNVNANNSISSLTIDGGSILNIANGATLTVLNTELVMRNGEIRGSIAGFTSLRKLSNNSAGYSDLASAFNGPIFIDKGALSISNSGSGVISVNAPTGASLNIGATSRTIVLNNALGDASPNPSLGQGAFIFSGTFSGQLDLGSIGSAISSSNINGPVTLSGSVTGASLIVVSTSTFSPLSFESSSSTYTGQTELYSPMQVANAGRLSSTSAIVLFNGGNLVLTGNTNPDQVPDNIPILGNGGNITLSSAPSQVPGPRSETVGSFSANLGASSIVLSTSASSVALTLAILNRAPGATVAFVADSGTGSPPDPNSHIVFAVPPPLHNGIIGGWATFRQIPGAQFIDGPPDFASYGPTGVVPVAAYQTNLNAATPADNVNLGADTTLTASKTINSLRVIAATLNLGGNTLTVDSGGVILYPTHPGANPKAIIQNGTLLPSANSNGELIVTGAGTDMISANIADYPGGSTQLTVAGFGITLAGTNSFTGPTHVASGQVIFNSPTAVPPNNDLFLDGGGAYFNFTSSTPIAFNTITTGPNYLQIGSSAAPLTLSASAYSFNQLDLFVALTGNGPMNISGHTIINGSGGNLAAYSGDIAINDGGILTLNAINPFTASLGTGNVTINPGGQVLVKYSMTGNVILNGGRLQNGISFAGSAHVTADSIIADLPVTGPISIDSTAQLTLEDASTQSITGGSILTPKYATATTDRITSLNLTVNGTHILRQNNSAPSTLATLTIAGTPDHWTARLDLNNNNLIVANGSDIPNQLKQGAALGDWYGNGIGSIAAAHAATTSSPTALAYATGSQFTAGNGKTTFEGLTFLPTDTLILYTLAGDANMDKSVTFADFLQLQNHYNQAGTDWQGGDFNYDNNTTFADFLILQNNYNKTLQPGNLSPTSSTPIPEPAPLLLLVTSLFAFSPRRSLHSKFNPS